MNKEMQKPSDELTEELFTFLDDSTLFVQQVLEQLTLLRAAVIRRDENTLQQMLKSMAAMGTANRDTTAAAAAWRGFAVS